MTATRIARLDRAVVRVAGAEARGFLQSLLTQDVEGLGEGEVRFGALLSPPGRVLFDLFLWGEADGVALDVAAGRRAALMQRLSMYRLRARVEIEEDARTVLASWPDVAAGFAADPRGAGLGGRRLDTGDAAADAGPADWDAHRLAAGVPDTADWADDKTYPIEANFDLLNGIDFRKGCFVGQETTSRMKRRGAIKSRMLPLDVEGAAPAAGAEVLAGDLRAGEVTSGRDGAAVALLRLDRIGGELSVEGRPARVRRPEWMEG